MGETKHLRIAIDTGGTFTDLVVLDEKTGAFWLNKSSTTPANTLIGIMNVIEKEKLAFSEATRLFVHGSTTAINALLERKGANTAYIATRGFRDVPEIMRYNRPEMYNPKYHKPSQLVPESSGLRYPRGSMPEGVLLPD
ncbi:MAG: hypothetical protein M5U22_10630 [Thermoleophilia bacterium]|nr:hypothetical protein [Thermoleophilia bacterium]